MKEYYLRLDHEMIALALLQRTALRRLDLAYSEFIEYDFALMRRHLPNEARVILDIGAGIAGIDARLAQLYPAADFYLLDKSGFEVQYGTETEQVFYNSQSAAQRLLRDNGVLDEHIHLLDAGPDYGIDIYNVDVALSLFSWGWHYPVRAYAAAASAAIKPGGLLVMDVRNWDGKEELFTWFELGDLIKLFDGHRCFLRRKPDEGERNE